MSWRRWFSLLAVAVVILGTIASCRRWFSHRVTPESEARVYAWILCEECDRGEREHVVALGDAVVPLLQRLLRDGPPAERRQQIQNYLAPLALPRPGRAPVSRAIVASLAANYELLYRVKAASALSLMNGGNALRALCEVRRRNAPDPIVTGVIDTALARRPGGGTCP